MAVVSSYTSVGPQGDAALDYNIEIIFEDSADFSWGDTTGAVFDVATIELIQAAFINAAETISDIIIGDVEDFSGNVNFGGGDIRLVEVEDIQLTATLENFLDSMGGLDGVGSVLGSAGPILLRPSGDDQFLPVLGQMSFDIPDVPSLLANGTWEDVILHEMIHTLGLGTIWDQLGLTDESDDTDIRYLGTNGNHEWELLFPTEFANDPNAADGAPIESVDGPGEALGDGTTGAHWEQDVFGDNDIMTGFIGPPGMNPISNLTIAGLADLGYETTYVATPCFLTGTAIATPTGAVAVETLSIGQRILTADGSVTEVRWVGRRSVENALAPEAWRDVVEIAPGALGSGLPVRPLRVTSDHALLLDGVLVQAGALVNGTNITWYAPETAYTVYHIETAAHEAILAEGSAAETFVDYITRRAFENYGEYVALYGEGLPLAEMEIPRIGSARHLPPALAQRLGLTRAA